MNKKMGSVIFLSIMYMFGAINVSAYTTVDGYTNDHNTDVIKGDISLVDLGDANQLGSCVDLKSTNLRYRSSDSTTNGEVSALQTFLASGSFLKTQVSGFFGMGTFSAVKLYQRSVGISPTGSVGALTKLKIKNQTCGSVVDVPATTNGGGMMVACTMEARLCPDGTMMPRDYTTCKWQESKCGELKRTSPGNPESGNTGAIKEVIINTTSAPLLYKTCSNEVKLCPNGTRMQRDPVTCEWNNLACFDTKVIEPVIIKTQVAPATVSNPLVPKPCEGIACGAASAGKSEVYYQYDPLPPVKKYSCPMMLTQECSDGSARQRNPVTCEWLSCPATNTLQPLLKSGVGGVGPLIPLGVPATVE